METINGPTAANGCLKYIRIISKWGKKRGHCKELLGLYVDKAKKRKLRRLPDSQILDTLIEFSRERGARKSRTKDSCAPYLWCALIIGYELRARGFETNKLTDADLSDIGLRNIRGKGSRTNITEWNQILKNAKDFLIQRRKQIWGKKNYPIPVQPSDRFLFVTETGDPLARSSLDSAYKRLINLAIKEGIMTSEQRFGMHGLKRRGTTDTRGTRAEKQEATGHKSEGMMEIYDFSEAIVKPVSD